MKNQIRISKIAGIAAAAAMASASSPATAETKANALATFGRLQFIQNAGQWDRHVRFLGHAPGVDMWVTDTGITYDYYRDGKSETRKGHTVKISFAGGVAAKKSEVVGLGKRTSMMSYFIGADKSKWVSKASVYDAAKIKNLYDGIDLVAYFDQKRKLPRYDLVVHPGANPSKIAMRYAGADRLQLAKSGSLGYATSLGRVEERELLAYQPHEDDEIGKLRDGIASGDARAKSGLQKVDAKVKIGDDGFVRFALSHPDPSRSVVIDPLIWSTFIGTSADDIARAFTTGPDGSLFITGRTGVRSTFPTTPGAYSSNKIYNTYCCKLSANGSTLLYGAIIGGATSQTNLRQSIPNAIAVDSFGCAFVAGKSSAPDFPTANALLAPFPGPITYGSGYLFKLSPDGSTLRFSTMVRGSNPQDVTNINGLALDSFGAPVIVGQTTANDLITSGGLVSDKGGNPGFCIKLATDGSRVQFATDLGGPGTAAVLANGVALDPDNNVYITGSVSSPSTYPTTTGAFQPAIPGVTNDNCQIGFISKIHADGSRFDYSTLLGPPANTDNVTNELNGIAVDSKGAAYVIGFTQNDQFPLTAGSYQATFPQNGGATASKLSPDGSHLVYSTFYCSPNGADGATTFGYQGMFVDSTGVLTFCGTTNSDGIPVLEGAVEPTGLAEPTFYIARLSGDGSTLLYSSYFGLWNTVSLAGIARASNTGVYVVGNMSEGQNFPTTPGAYEVDPKSRAYVARIDLTPGLSVQLPTNAFASGEALLGTVTLAAPATDSTLVYLTGGSYLTVPSFTIVPKGQRTATFPILANTVNASSIGMILARSATGTGYGYNAIVVVPSAQVSSLTASPTSVVGGATNVTVKITLHAPAGGSGSTIKILNSNVNALDLPAQSTVVVPTGKSSYSFTVKSKVVASDATSNLSCVDGQNVTTSGGSVTVKPLLPTALSTGATVLVPGNTYVGKVNLNGKVLAPTSVTLTSNNPYVSVPSAVTVPSGSNTASFDITPSISFPGPTATVNISASLPGGSVQRAAKISPILVTKLALAAKTLYGGYSTNATVTLSQAAPNGGLSVPVTSSVSGYPATITVVVPAGSKTGTGAVTLPLAYSGADQTVTLTASKNGSSASTTVMLTALKIIGVSMSSTNVKGGTNVTLLVKFNAPAMANATVSLTSDSGSVMVPSTVTLAAGQRAVSVPVTTNAVTAITTAHIEATFNGSQATATLRLVK